jgi:hypothetical protein
VHIEMAKLSKDLVSGTLHPRETLFLSGNFGALNAETIVAADGAATVSVDLRGTFNLTVTVEATIDGTNWQMVAMRPLNGAAAGYVAATPYALRNDLEPRWIVKLDAQFVRRDATAPAAGDILLLRAGPAQFHLGLWSGQGLIHADARLRRVVEWPGLPDWPLIGLWHAG